VGDRQMPAINFYDLLVLTRGAIDRNRR